MRRSTFYAETMVMLAALVLSFFEPLKTARASHCLDDFVLCALAAPITSNDFGHSLSWAIGTFFSTTVGLHAFV